MFDPTDPLYDDGSTEEIPERTETRYRRRRPRRAAAVLFLIFVVVAAVGAIAGVQQP